jgi:hypothetical protein
MAGVTYEHEYRKSSAYKRKSAPHKRARETDGPEEKPSPKQVLSSTAEVGDAAGTGTTDARPMLPISRAAVRNIAVVCVGIIAIIIWILAVSGVFSSSNSGHTLSYRDGYASMNAASTDTPNYCKGASALLTNGDTPTEWAAGCKAAAAHRQYVTEHPGASNG